MNRRVLKRYPVAKFREDLKRLVARLELIGGAAIVTNHANDGPILMPLDILTMDRDAAFNFLDLLRHQYAELKKIDDPKGEEEIELDDERSAQPATGVRVIGGRTAAEAKRGRRHG